MTSYEMPSLNNLREMRSPYGACTASTHYTLDSLDEVAESIGVAQLRHLWTEASACPHTMQGSKLLSLYPIRSSDVAPKVDLNDLNADQPLITWITTKPPLQ